MTNFENIKSYVQSMIGLKYGSYKASVENMEKKYQHGLGSSIYYANPYSSNEHQSYLNNNGKEVAWRQKITVGENVVYTIHDVSTGRIYSSDWQSKNSNSDKFTSIEFKGYIIKDDGNGIVDENDMIEDKLNGGKSISVGDLLNDNY